jgi:hypothetical protein
VKIDAAEKSQKPELVVQSNLIQGNLTSQMGQMELQEEKGGCWLLVYSARTRGVFSFFFSQCPVRSLEVDAPGQAR